MKVIRNKEILVIGGAGFIGSHLCEFLCDHNNVISLDNYSTGKKENHVDKVNYLKGSSKDIFNLDLKLNPDYVFHLGEYSRVETSFEDYSIVIENNLASFSKVLEFTKLKNAKLIYCGSSTKFAKYSKDNFLSPYAWTKSINTEHLINYAKWFDLKYAIVYFYNAYGGNEIGEGKFSTLIAKYKKLYSDGKRKLPLVKPGSQKRNFTHYSDIIRALNLVALKGEGDGFGIGSEVNVSVKEVIKYFGCKPIFLPERKGNRTSAKLFVSKTKKLGWEPKIKLKDHIEDFLEENS